jgi:multiple sugar transport system permease protein
MMARARRLTLATMLGPATLVLIAVFGLPITYSVFTSLQVTGTPVGTVNWAALRQYQAILEDSSFWHACWVSLMFTVACVILTYVVGLALALLVHKRVPGARTAQMISVVPWAMPWVAAAIIWASIFDYQYGPLNYLLKTVGLLDENAGWLTSPALALPSVIIVQVWKMFPLAAVMLLAGLQAIPVDREEAAAVDGANAWQSLRHVLMPGLRSVSTILTLLMTIWVFGRSFTVIYVLTGGGPADATSTLVIETFRVGFQLFDTQKASALGTLILIISAVLTLVYWVFGLRKAND